jgi:hypothetical protein
VRTFDDDHRHWSYRCAMMLDIGSRSLVSELPVKRGGYKSRGFLSLLDFTANDFLRMQTKRDTAAKKWSGGRGRALRLKMQTRLLHVRFVLRYEQSRRIVFIDDDHHPRLGIIFITHHS